MPKPNTRKAAKRRRLPRGAPRKPMKTRLRAKLMLMRAALKRSNQDLADEALKASGRSASPDQIADLGSASFDQDFSLALLEGETEILQRIELAIAKIDGTVDQPFGACETCLDDDPWDVERGQPWIPVGRLEVLPYARLCVIHQEALEED